MASGSSVALRIVRERQGRLGIQAASPPAAAGPAVEVADMVLDRAVEVGAEADPPPVLLLPLPEGPEGRQEIPLGRLEEERVRQILDVSLGDPQQAERPEDRVVIGQAERLPVGHVAVSSDLVIGHERVHRPASPSPASFGASVLGLRRRCRPDDAELTCRSRPTCADLDRYFIESKPAAGKGAAPGLPRKTRRPAQGGSDRAVSPHERRRSRRSKASEARRSGVPIFDGPLLNSPQGRAAGTELRPSWSPTATVGSRRDGERPP